MRRHKLAVFGTRNLFEAQGDQGLGWSVPQQNLRRAMIGIAIPLAGGVPWVRLVRTATESGTVGRL